MSNIPSLLKLSIMANLKNGVDMETLTSQFKFPNEIKPLHPVLELRTSSDSDSLIKVEYVKVEQEVGKYIIHEFSGGNKYLLMTENANSAAAFVSFKIHQLQSLVTQLYIRIGSSIKTQNGLSYLFRRQVGMGIPDIVLPNDIYDTMVHYMNMLADITMIDY